MPKSKTKKSLSSGFKFSKKTLLLIILPIAAIGAWFIYSSFAATNDYQITGLKASSIKKDSVTLTWKKPKKGTPKGGYDVFRKDGPKSNSVSDYEPVAKDGYTKLKFVDPADAQGWVDPLRPNRKYTYCVRANWRANPLLSCVTVTITTKR